MFITNNFCGGFFMYRDKNVTDRIKELSNKYFNELVSIRRHLHMFPELSNKEFETKKYILSILREYDLTIDSNIGDTGISAVLKGCKEGKTIALRADMDALHIEEKNSTPYISKNKGVMHACGHDAHITFAIGTMMVLYQMREFINGNVKFIFQPAEETNGGAKRMVKEGVLENPKVDAVIGGHIWPELDSNKIGVKVGPIMSSPDVFDIIIHGKGGHAGKPDKTIDPIIIASEIVTSFQNCIVKNTNPFEPVVISTCYIQSGSTYNVIPDYCTIKGTVRTYNKSTRSFVEKRMHNIIANICNMYGAKFSFNYTKRFPPTINEPNITNLIEHSALKILGKDRVSHVEHPSMSSEDFSYFLEKVPGSYIFIGTRNEEKKIVNELHSPYFDIDESVLKTGIQVYAQSIIDYLNRFN